MTSEVPCQQSFRVCIFIHRRSDLHLRFEIEICAGAEGTLLDGSARQAGGRGLLQFFRDRFDGNRFRNFGSSSAAASSAAASGDDGFFGGGTPRILTMLCLMRQHSFLAKCHYEVPPPLPLLLPPRTTALLEEMY